MASVVPALLHSPQSLICVRSIPALLIIPFSLICLRSSGKEACVRERGPALMIMRRLSTVCSAQHKCEVHELILRIPHFWLFLSILVIRLEIFFSGKEICSDHKNTNTPPQWKKGMLALQ